MVCMELSRDCKVMMKELSAVERPGVVEQMWTGEQERDKMFLFLN